MPRIVTLVLDSAGVGALPDAAQYGDAPGANTIGNVAERVGGLRLPTLERLGIGTITHIRGVSAPRNPAAVVGRLRELSRGKDTITGHWEMAGIITEVPFPTYPNGFPPEIVEKFTAIAGKPPLGNKTASGTEIIAELGDEHVRTGRPILYTSADSVFQVAAHEAVVPLPTLYDWCERARAMLVPPHNVNRVIARPFVGESGAYRRTPNRRDFAIEPPPSVLDRLAAAGIAVHAVGKISDIYSGHGIRTSDRVADNHEGMRVTMDRLAALDRGLVFTNLGDFDTKYGHRRDVRGYAAALEAFDMQLGELLNRLRPGDAVLLTADHGCDPTAPGTDHTREFVPFLEVEGGGESGGQVGTIEGLDHIGKRLATLLT
ncbi:MAG: phosphopentomutase [Candidatus Eremiobacteraeota bacterium]|nr:phosphopentomutase [Candidatus Eremiobacteraeota bacterium]